MWRGGVSSVGVGYVEGRGDVANCRIPRIYGSYMYMYHV